MERQMKCTKCGGSGNDYDTGTAGHISVRRREFCEGTGEAAVENPGASHPAPVPDGGPSSYYDFDPGWCTFNDFMEAKAATQWHGHALHLKDVGKAICRFGVKIGASKSYDARKIIYSGLRLLGMLEGRAAVRAELHKLLADPQFKENK